MAEYSFVQVIIHAKSPKSVLLSVPSLGTDEAWVPHLKIHALDLPKLADLDPGDETELRIEDQFCLEKGLV